MKRYGRKPALEGVDLQLTGAQLVGVVGPDGAGKTTLLRAIAGLLEVEAQRANVLGYDLRGDVRALKAQVGYVPQVFALNRDLSVIENLRFTGKLHRIASADFERRAEELLAAHGARAVRRSPRRRALGRHEAEARRRERAAARAGAARARRVHRRRRRGGARRDRRVARGAPRRSAGAALDELPRRGGVLRPTRLPRRGSRRRDRHARRIARAGACRAVPRVGGGAACDRSGGSRAAVRRRGAHQWSLRARRGRAGSDRPARRACSPISRHSDGVRLVESLPLDMETTLLALARSGARA